MTASPGTQQGLACRKPSDKETLSKNSPVWGFLVGLFFFFLDITMLPHLRPVLINVTCETELAKLTSE